MTLSGLPCWALIPASGVGARMSADRPKQYLEVSGKTILEHTLDRLTRHDAIDGVILVLNPSDCYWTQVNYQSEKPLYIVDGGVERKDSVLMGLRKLTRLVDDDAMVLIHDAVRPLLSSEDLDRLLSAVEQSEAGAILATPVTDTLKRATSDQMIETTQSRAQLWRAQTPQGFALKQIREALEEAINSGLEITDDASAMEAKGFKPQLVEGSPWNIKITYPQDIEIARLMFEAQASLIESR